MIYGKCSSRQRPHDTTPSNRTPGFVRKHQAPCRPLPIEPEDGGEIARTDPTVDATDGTQVSQSTVLTSAEKTIVATFRQKTLLPRDDVLDCSFNTLPTSVAVRYTVACHAMASPRLPIEETRERHKQFKFYEISYVHIDRCEFRHAESQLVIFLAISRVSKFTMSSSTNAREKWRGGVTFLRDMVEALPYRIHTVLTDNGMAFADLPKNHPGSNRRFLGPNIFNRVCIANSIERRIPHLLRTNVLAGISLSRPKSHCRRRER